MSDNPAEKRQGFERWVASLKLGVSARPEANEAASEDSAGGPLTLDEQATLINRIPKEVIYKLRERDSQRATPKSEDNTAVFTPPPELLARARRFQAPPKPERSSPTAPPEPLSSVEAPAFESLGSDEEATTFFRPNLADVPTSRPPPPALSSDVSRPGDMQWIDALAESHPPSQKPHGARDAAPAPHRLLDSPPGSPVPASRPSPVPASFRSAEPEPFLRHEPPSVSSIAPAERRVRWVALVVAVVLLAGIFALSRMQ